MPQKKISQLTSISSEAVNESDNFEISTKDLNYNNTSGKISTKDIGKAIYSRLHVADDNKTIKQKVEEAKNNNEYSQLVLVDEKGGKWLIWAESSTGIRMMSEDVAEWYKQMDEYMAYMNAPAETDPHHNYQEVATKATSELPSDYYTQEDINSLLINGETLYTIYTNPEQYTKTQWGQAKIIFDPLYKRIRYAIGYDDEFNAINSKLETCTTNFTNSQNWFVSHENDPILIINPSTDPQEEESFHYLFVVTDSQDPTKKAYLQWLHDKILADCNEAKTVYTTTPNQEHLTTFETKVEIAESYLYGDKDLTIFMIYFECGIGPTYMGYNTYNEFLYDEATNPRSFDNGGPLDKEYHDMLIALTNYLKNSVDYMRTYFRNITEPSPERKNRPIVLEYIDNANTMYENIQDFINAHEEDS